MKKITDFLVKSKRSDLSRIRYNYYGSVSNLAKSVRIRPDPDPQHCFKMSSTPQFDLKGADSPQREVVTVLPGNSKLLRQVFCCHAHRSLYQKIKSQQCKRLSVLTYLYTCRMIPIGPGRALRGIARPVSSR